MFIVNVSTIFTTQTFIAYRRFCCSSLCVCVCVCVSKLFSLSFIAQNFIATHQTKQKKDEEEEEESIENGVMLPSLKSSN